MNTENQRMKNERRETSYQLPAIGCQREATERRTLMKDKVYLVWAIDPGHGANDLLGVFQTQKLAGGKSQVSSHKSQVRSDRLSAGDVGDGELHVARCTRRGGALMCGIA